MPPFHGPTKEISWYFVEMTLLWIFEAEHVTHNDNVRKTADIKEKERFIYPP
jgi:hypothetical protein